MHSRNHQIIFVSLATAIGLLLACLYSYVYTYYKTQSALSFYKAPDDYQGFTLPATPQPLTLSYAGEAIILSSETIHSWYQPYHRSYTGTDGIRLDSNALDTYFNGLGATIDSPAVDAKLNFEDGKITQFVAPQSGHKLDREQSYINIAHALAAGQTSAQLAIRDTQPAITLERINQLGITTLLARGESNFKTSSNSRIHNIKTAIRLFENVLVKPNEEFSFNKILGDVDAVTGYEPELVIKNKAVVKEYGGGICQVSTTLFRAAILSGLPIIERKPHTLPVHYYNPQGFDATVYPGVVDLKFVNDTGNNILIQPRIAGTKLSFDIYGSNDGRKVSMSQPHQYGSGPDGGPRYVFDRIIELANGEILKQSFYSLYRAPQATPSPGQSPQPSPTTSQPLPLHNPLE